MVSLVIVLGCVTRLDSQTDPSSDLTRLSLGKTSSQPETNKPAENRLQLGENSILATDLQATSTHPHLFFDQPGMEALRDLVLTDARLNTIWQRFKVARVDSALRVVVTRGNVGNVDIDESREYGDALSDLSIAYVVERDERYVDKALEIITDLAPKSSWGNKLTVAHISMGFALSWDIMYQRFSSSEKSMIRNAILAHADNGISNKVYANTNWTPAAAQGLVGLAFQGDGDGVFNNFTNSLLAEAKRNFKEKDRNVLWAHGTDGFPHQGLGYWRKYNHVGAFFHALRFNEPANDWYHLGEAYPGSEFLKNTAYPRIYADVQHPDLATLTWADSRQVRRKLDGNFGNLGVMTLVASEYKDGYVLDFIDHLLNEVDTRFDPEDWATFLFYDTANVVPTSYRDLPLSRYWPDMEAAIFRSGWDNNDLVFYMRCGSPGGHGRRLKHLTPGGHDHPDANGFVIFYNNDYLAAEDGVFPHIGPDEGNNKITYGHNTLLIDGQGQRGDKTRDVATTSANMDFMDTEHVGYLLGNASDAYSNIDQFYRYIIYKKHKYFIVVDDLKDDTSHKYEFLLGTDHRHSITSSGNGKFSINSVDGNAKMPVVFVEPRQLNSSIAADRPYNIVISMVDMLRVWPQTQRSDAVFFSLHYPLKSGDPEPRYTRIYDGDRSGIIVDGDEYHIYNKKTSLYSYGNIRTDARLCYFKDDPANFEYLTAGSKEFLYKDAIGITSDKPLVAAFEGVRGKIRLGKNLGSFGEAEITLHYPGISTVRVDAQLVAVTARGPGWVKFNLNPKQHKIGPPGAQQTVTDNYRIQMIVNQSGELPPVVESFNPVSGRVGTEVEIIGMHFDGATDVDFGVVAATSFSTVSDSLILADVPVGAATGKITVTSTAGSGSSLTDFVVLSSGQDTTLTFVPVEDVYVRLTQPTMNYSDRTSLKVMKNKFRSYLKFDVSGITGTVSSARLHLHVSDESDEGGSIYLVDNTYAGSDTPWDEEGLTARTAPAIDDIPLSAVGAVGVGETVEFDVTGAIVHDSTYSFAIITDSFDQTRYATKETNEGPRLVITTRSASPASQHILSVTTEGAGTVTLSPSGSLYQNGTEVELTAVPAPGWQFAEWHGDLTGSANPDTLVMDTDKSVTARFDTIPLPLYRLSIQIDGAGSVTLNPPDSLYEEGTEVELTAVPAPGWQFAEWHGDLTDSANPDTLLMNSDKSVTARFDTIPLPLYRLRIQIDGAGSVTLNPPDSLYEEGTEVELTAVPAPRWQFTEWLGDLTGQANPDTLEMDSDKKVIARFAPLSGDTTLTFQPTDDAFVRLTQPARNFGDRTSLKVMKNKFRSYMKFKVTGTAGTVRSATLRLHAHLGGENGGSTYLVSNDYAGIDSLWREGGLTARNAPTLSGLALSSVGQVSDDEIIEFDVTPVVDGDGTFSFAIDGNSFEQVRYDSKERDFPPELVIETAASVGVEVAKQSHVNNLLQRATAPQVELPRAFALNQNYPNPFNPETVIQFQLPRSSTVMVEIFNIQGQHIATLLNTRVEAGYQSVVWNGRSTNGNPVSSGVYLYHIRADEFLQTRKMTLLR